MFFKNLIVINQNAIGEPLARSVIKELYRGPRYRAYLTVKLNSLQNIYKLYIWSGRMSLRG